MILSSTNNKQKQLTIITTRRKQIKFGQIYFYCNVMKCSVVFVYSIVISELMNCGDWRQTIIITKITTTKTTTMAVDNYKKMIIITIQ